MSLQQTLQYALERDLTITFGRRREIWPGVSLLSYESDAEAFMEAPASCRAARRTLSMSRSITSRSPLDRAIDEVAALGAPRRDADT